MTPGRKRASRKDFVDGKVSENTQVKDDKNPEPGISNIAGNREKSGQQFGDSSRGAWNHGRSFLHCSHGKYIQVIEEMGFDPGEVSALEVWDATGGASLEFHPRNPSWDRVVALQQTLRGKDKVIADLEWRMGEYEEVIKGLRGTIADRDKMIAGRCAEFQRLEANSQGLNERRDKERSELTEKVDEMHRQKQSLADKLAAETERLEEALEQSSELTTKLQEVEKRRQSAEDRCATLAADKRHLRNGLALLQAEDAAVAVLREARLRSLQQKVSDLEGQLSTAESTGAGIPNEIVCLDKDDKEVKFALDSANGVVKVYKNGALTGRDCPHKGADGKIKLVLNPGSITGKIFATHGKLKPVEIDRDVSTDDNSASEVGSVTARAAADPGTRGPRKRSNTNTGHGAWRDGDWKCDGCGFSNFERREECKECNKPRLGEEEQERERIRSQFRRDHGFRRQLLDRMEFPERVAND